MVVISKENMRTYKELIRYKKEKVQSYKMEMQNIYHSCNAQNNSIELIYRQLLRTRREIEDIKKYIQVNS